MGARQRETSIPLITAKHFEYSPYSSFAENVIQYTSTHLLSNVRRQHPEAGLLSRDDILSIWQDRKDFLPSSLAGCAQSTAGVEK